MRTSNKKFFIVECIAILIICFSSVVYAATGYTPHIDTIQYGTNEVNGFTTQKSYFIVDSTNSIELEMTDGKHTATLDPNTRTYKLEDGTELKNVTFMLNGQGEAYIPGNVDKDENGNLRIMLNGNNISESDFGKLTINFTRGSQQYNASIGNVGRVVKGSSQETGTSFGEHLWNLVKSAATFWRGNLDDSILRLANYIINQILIPLGDGVIGFISRSVGEVVTIDRLIFGKVDKVSIDYWSKGGENAVRSIMANVVTPWYGVFRRIAIMVYMIMLIFVGIMIMINSTAETKAKYKNFLVSWVVGVCMLMFFPYVMKYIVQLNNAVIVSMEGYINGNAGQVSVPKKEAHIPELITVSEGTAAKSYGNEKFLEYINVTQMDGSTGIMLKIRIIAYYTDQVFLTIIYLILIGEMIVLLVMYYKRAFMIAFLITIFPLVAMTYVIDKAGDRKAQSFEIWFKEYIVNVVVQIFHAVVYILMVGSSINQFINNGGKNWLFVIISVLFLFQGEKILRGIFGVNSKAQTIGDLAATGLATVGVVRSIGRLRGKDGGNASEQDRKDAAGIQERNTQRSSMAASETGAAANARREMTGTGGSGSGGEAASGGGTGGTGGSDSSGSGNNSGNYGQQNGRDPREVGGSAPYDHEAAMDRVGTSSMQRRWRSGLASRGVNFAGGAMGALVGATYGMSKGDTGNGVLGNGLESAASGKTLGQGAVAPLKAATNKVEQKVQGARVARRIANGDMDQELGLTGPGTEGLAMPAADVNADEVVGKHGESMQEIYRQALIEFNKVASTKGMPQARQAYWNYIENNTKTKE